MHVTLVKHPRYNVISMHHCKREPLPESRFGSIHDDIVGPLPESEGMKYLFTVINRFTRRPEAIPVQEVKAEDCAKAFLRHFDLTFCGSR